MSKKTHPDALKLNAEIVRILELLAKTDPVSADYKTLALQLEHLYKSRSLLKEPPQVSADTVALVVGNLAGIALILGYERLNVVTSKALGFVIKSKI